MIFRIIIAFILLAYHIAIIGICIWMVVMLCGCTSADLTVTNDYPIGKPIIGATIMFHREWKI